MQATKISNESEDSPAKRYLRDITNIPEATLSYTEVVANPSIDRMSEKETRMTGKSSNQIKDAKCEDLLPSINTLSTTIFQQIDASSENENSGSFEPTDLSIEQLSSQVTNLESLGPSNSSLSVMVSNQTRQEKPSSLTTHGEEVSPTEPLSLDVFSDSTKLLEDDIEKLSNVKSSDANGTKYSNVSISDGHKLATMHNHRIIYEQSSPLKDTLCNMDENVDKVYSTELSPLNGTYESKVSTREDCSLCTTCDSTAPTKNKIDKLHDTESEVTMSIRGNIDNLSYMQSTYGNNILMEDNSEKLSSTEYSSLHYSPDISVKDHVHKLSSRDQLCTNGTSYSAMTTITDDLIKASITQFCSMNVTTDSTVSITANNDKLSSAESSTLIGTAHSTASVEECGGITGKKNILPSPLFVSSSVFL